MSERKTRSYSRFYRFYRKIRYLSFRGTLFHSRSEEIIPNPIPVKKKKKKSLAIIRKLRFLYRKGVLFKPRYKEEKHPIPPVASSSLKTKRYTAFYSSYRKIRFLINTGRLVKKGPQEDNYEIKRVKRVNPTYRKLRYLSTRGRLFKSSETAEPKKKISSFGFLLNKEYLIILFNSTSLFIIASLFLYLVMNFTTSLVALNYNVKTVIFYFKIVFLVNNYRWLYDPIVMTFSSGPFISLIVAITSLIIYYNTIERNRFVNLLFLWLFCLGMVHFFGEFSLGLLLYKGFGIALAYFFINFKELDKLIMIILALAILIITGVFTSRILMLSGNHYFKEIKSGNKTWLMNSQFIFPAITGTLVLLMLKLPKVDPFEIYISLSTLLILLPAVLRAESLQDCMFDEEPRKISIHWKAFLLCIAMMSIFRIIFGIGIRIG